jgi:hypothetical protein
MKSEIGSSPFNGVSTSRSSGLLLDRRPLGERYRRGFLLSGSVRVARHPATITKH